MKSVFGRLGKRLYLFAKYIVLALFACITIYLVYMAGFSTSYINLGEHSYLVSDSFLKNILFVAVVVAAGCLCLKKAPLFTKFISRVNEDVVFSKKARRIVLFIIGAAAVYFVLVSQAQPGADAAEVEGAANNWLLGDYSALLPGEYLDRYPNQLGLAILLYLFAHVFGSLNYIVFQLFNVAALLLLYRAFAQISDEMGASRFTGLAVLIASGLFLPGILYTTFVYGTLIGLSASVNSFLCILRFEKRKKAGCLAAAIALAFLAVMIKSNYEIFLIGLILYVLARLLKKPNGRMLVAMEALAVVLFCSGSVIKGTTYAITGEKPGEGNAAVSWVAMGLQDTDEPFFDGWYNLYTYNTYTESGFNTEKQEEQAKEYIRDRLSEFRKHPGKGLRFFSRKNASQWNNPNFQGFWVNQAWGHNGHYPYFLYWILSEAGSAKISAAMNYLQFLLLIGVLLLVFLTRGKPDGILYYEMIVIGGFLFHTFWEAKCQYTFPYFMLLVPLSVLGYRTVFIAWLEREFVVLEKSGKKARFEETEALERLFCTLEADGLPGRAKAGGRPGKAESDGAEPGKLIYLWKRIKPRHIRGERYYIFVAVFLAGALLIRYGNIAPLNEVFLHTEDTQEYTSYIAGRTYLHLKGGEYTLVASSDGKEIGATSDGAVTIQASEADDNISILTVSGKKYLSVLKDHGAREKEGLEVSMTSTDGADGTGGRVWEVAKSAESGKVNILYQGSWALTIDEKSGKLSLSDNTDSENQRWSLVKQE